MASSRLLALAILASCVSHAWAQGGQPDFCFEEGSVVGCDFIDYIREDEVEGGIPDANKCLQICQDYRDPNDEDRRCYWWSYSRNNVECWLFENNVGGICSIGPWEGCDNCVSGQSECIAQYECRVEGQCEEGGFVQDGIIGEVPSEDECLQLCKDQAAMAEEDSDLTACSWYSYDESIERCMLFDGCPVISVPDCEDCNSGQMECELADPEVTFTHVLVSGGLQVEGAVTEVFDLEDARQTCPKPAEFPFPGLHGSGAGYVGGKLLVCGGIEFTTPVDTCWVYQLQDSDDGEDDDEDSGVGQWVEQEDIQLDTKRGDTVAVKLDSNRLWITGGWDGEGTSRLSSTEIYNDIRQAFEEGPELPRGSSEHCLIRLGVASTRFMFVGGNPLDTSVYIYDDATGEWTDDGEIDDLPVSLKGAFCGYYEDGGSGYVVVSAGFSTQPSSLAFIYDIDDNRWNDDRDAVFPRPFAYNGISIPYRGSFVALSATDGNEVDPEVREFDTGRGEFNEIDNLEIQYDHSFGFGVLVPDSVFPCDGDE